MSERDRKRLREIHTFPALVKYLREDLGWPVEQDSFDDLDDITFDWEADELGIDPDQAARIEYIKQLRPLEHGEPQGVFFVKFDTKNLPVVALRRLLSKLVIKKRASAGAAERPLWQMRNLVFISSYGESDERQLSFAYFQEPEHKGELPSLKVLGWDAGDTPLHLDRVHDQLEAHLAWPENAKELPQWRKQWSAAFELRHGEVVTTAKQLAEQLATLARGIRERANQLLKLETDTGPLRTLMEGFKKALIHDLTEDQFADMYAQTIAYGLLSARITHPDPVKAETLPDLIPVTNPFLKELMETFVLAGGKHRGRKRGHHLDFDELGINDVVGLLRRANMDAVLRNFGADDRREDPVTYFYEDFLNAYDKQERKRRGVYYTPKPVVSYIVRSVHELLQTEFGIEDGLASTITWGELVARSKDLKIPAGTSSDSPFVQILDPATGTATFLVTVIEVIYDTLNTKWIREGLSEKQRVEAWNDYVPQHLLPRLFGYELMMAPYAIAHLKIGLKLFETGYRFGSEERARIYLTNALEPASDASHTQIDALSEALAHEAEAVNRVKRLGRFPVVIGNPPYSNYGQLNRIPFILGLLEDYKRNLNERKINLDDDFIKFLRFGQWLVMSANIGILGLITNNSFLEGLTHRRMRQALVESFQHIRILNLHGSATLGETSPDGSDDENVFDIRQGVAISLFTRMRGVVSHGPSIGYQDLWGPRQFKYEQLTAIPALNNRVQSLVVEEPYFFFVPRSFDNRSEYDNYVPLRAVFIEDNTGIQTKRDSLAIQFTKAELRQALDDVMNLSESKLRERYELPEDGRDWQVAAAKADIGRSIDDELISRILYRPFDWRWTYFTGKTKGFLAYPRRETMRHMRQPNIALVTLRINGSGDDFVMLVADGLVEKGSLPRGNYSVFPLYSYADVESRQHGLDLHNTKRDNLQPTFKRALEAALGHESSADRRMRAAIAPVDIVRYAYAVFNSPTYRARYAQFLTVDFPRLPVPGSVSLFHDLVDLGAELVELHLLRSSKLDVSRMSFLGPRNPDISRVGWSDDTVWLDAAGTKNGQPAEPGTIGFKGVPEVVWNFHIGGYQVCEKWLKDRKGRKLLKADIEHYQKIVVALSETIRIMKEIDEVIEKHGGWPGAFKTGEGSGKKGH